MNPPYIAGRLSPVEMPIQTVWRRTGGSEHDTSVRALETSAREGALSVEITQQEGSCIAILTARYPGASPGSPPGDEDDLGDNVETVEIDFAEVTFPIHQNPTFIGITTANVITMEASLASSDANTQTAGSVEYRYYDLRSRKTESYEVAIPFVTWTRTVGLDYNTSMDLANVGAIFSTGNLAGSIGAPILFDIPTGNVGVLTGGEYTAGWKKGGRFTYVSDGKVQLVLTARYGLWANDLYTFIS
jgi:hypothetical protein